MKGKMVLTYCQTEETLGCSNDKRFTIIPLDLTTQEMEILRRSGGEDDLHVDVRLRFRGIRIIGELILNS